MDTVLNDDLGPRGDLELSSPFFEDSDRMPDSVGYVNDNANPPLEITGVPADAESLVLVMDDQDAQPVAGHTWDHWLAWDIDPDVGEIIEDWNASDTVEGYNDYVEQGYGGPSPPAGSHNYRFKLLALDSPLEMPPETGKTRLGSANAMNPEVLAAT